MIMEIIITIVQTTMIMTIILGAILSVYSYYKKAKRENERRLELALMRSEMIRLYEEDIDNAPRTIEPLYCDYKALGGDGIDEGIVSTLGSNNGLLICDTGTITSWEPNPVVIKPHHCECCGAPMPRGTIKCEYCGTEYY